MEQMTVSAMPEPAHRRPGPSPADRLVPFSEAAHRLGKTPDTLRRWHDEGHLPAVVSPGGQWSTYASFVSAVLGSALPGKPGVLEEIARAWFAERGLTAEAVA
jgi:hypothetical protein